MSALASFPLCFPLHVTVRITILQYDVEHNRLEKVHMETFGKSGVRRIVPGEFLATDPKGRAVMIGKPS